MNIITQHNRIKDLENELENLENKLMLKNSNLSIYDLKEIEGLANNIYHLRLKNADLLKENEIKK